MSSKLQVEFNNQQDLLEINEERLRAAILSVLQGEGITEAEISVGILDDPAIHALNREHLQHDYPTDILSFVFDRGDNTVDGELIASAETAIGRAAELNWPPHDELMLYLVHGTLHLVGYDDHEIDDRAEMRALERKYLSTMGVELPSNGFAGTGDARP